MKHRFPREVRLDLGLDEPDDAPALRERVARKLCVPACDLPPLRLRKRAIDARRGDVRFHVVLELETSDEQHAFVSRPLREVKGEPQVLIVGDGPAGLFCAYELARHGIGSTVLDRGKPVQPRRRDLKVLNQDGRVPEDSNYCFGEGGAGTYSDGKLYTRSDKRGDIRDVVEVLHAHGAPERIVTDARPHIGSNKLPKVVTALRTHLEDVGVRFRFDARVVALRTAPPAARGRIGRVDGVRLANGEELGARFVVLATGHSARDVYAMLASMGVALEAKAFALGVRIEHPQPLINSIQYGACAGHAKLPAAYYRLAENVNGRGVFSFCMCPGGWIVPAATESGEVVVNGMSLSKRNSPFANSGLVVAVTPEDVEALGHEGPLGGIELQRRVEQAAFVAGGGNLRAPATRATDFLRGRASSTVPTSSYIPGLTAGNIGEVLDAAGASFSDKLRAALRAFDRKMRGYVTEEAVLVGVESRTSSPVRIPRDRDTHESLELESLYPCGEGAGAAGGIVSAALDGINTARCIATAVGAAVTSGI